MNNQRTRIKDTSAQDTIMIESQGFEKYKKSILIGLPVAIMLIILVGQLFSKWSLAEATISKQRIMLATVERGLFVRDLSAQGQIVAAISPTLYSTATGTVTYQVKAGDRVEIGSTLAVIDSPETLNQLEQEQATLQSLQIEFDRQRIQAKIQKLENDKRVDMANVRLTAAKREMKRAEIAWKRQNISAIDYEKAQDDLENAELEYQHARADAALNEESLDFEVKTRQLLVDRQKLQVQNLQREVDELTIVSPVKGLVGNLLTNQKTKVNENQAVLSVIDMSVFEVEAQIPESYADELALGMVTEILIDGQSWAGELIAVSPEIINNQVTVRISFAEEAPSALRSNQRVSTRIIMEERDNVLMLRRGQFVSETGGRIAYQVEDDVAYRKQLTIGARSISHIEILGGAEEGDEFIISSIENFDNAESVVITQ